MTSRRLPLLGSALDPTLQSTRDSRNYCPETCPCFRLRYRGSLSPSLGCFGARRRHRAWCHRRSYQLSTGRRSQDDRQLRLSCVSPIYEYHRVSIATYLRCKTCIRSLREWRRSVCSQDMSHAQNQIANIISEMCVPETESVGVKLVPVCMKFSKVECFDLAVPSTNVWG